MPKNSALNAEDPLREYAYAAMVTGTQRPVPLIATRIAIRIDGGLATVTTKRTFRNQEEDSIEATMTFPAPVHATLLSLEAVIDGRVVTGSAQRRHKARDTYEGALDRGKTAVLHEEVLRGVHMISVGHVPPGKEVTVSGTWAMPLSFDGTVATLRVPTTVGDVYGRSPLAESDALIHGGSHQEADIELACTDGNARIAGASMAEGKTRIVLDAPIDVEISNWIPRRLRGVAADGRPVTLDIAPTPAVPGTLDVVVLADNSGSMNHVASGLSGSQMSKHAVMVAALAAEARTCDASDDIIDVWEFNDRARLVPGHTFADQVAALTLTPRGTDVGVAVDAVVAARPTRDVLLITDGKSFTLDVQKAAQSGRRFNVILIGEDSLEAGVGHLAAMTGGQLFIASGIDAGAAIRQAFAAMRLPRGDANPVSGVVQRALGGMLVQATWERADDTRIVGIEFPTMIEGSTESGSAKPCGTNKKAVVGAVEAGPDAVLSRSVAAVAAALAIPGMPEESAAALAEAEGIVCHLTSLVLVDEEGETQEGVPGQRKVATMTPRTVAKGMMLAASANASPMHGVMRSMSAASMSSMSAGSGLKGMMSVCDTGSSYGSPTRQSATGSWSSSPPTGKRPLNDLLDEMRKTAAGLRTAAPLPTRSRAPVSSSTSRADLKTARGMVDWAKSPESLRGGDLTQLVPTAALAILAASVVGEVVALAAELGISAVAVAVALLARDEGAGDRTAARIARAVLGKASEASIEAAARSVGL